MTTTTDDDQKPPHLSTVLGPPPLNWRQDKMLVALSTPLPKWTYETAMDAEDPEFQTPQMATMYRLLREERARVLDLERQVKSTIPDAEAACELLKRQA